MQRSWRVRRTELLVNRVIDENHLHIGIGISGGVVNFGEFGQSHRDLTAIGTVVNTAARAQTAAHAGQILVTATVRDRSKEENDIVYGRFSKQQPGDLVRARRAPAWLPALPLRRAGPGIETRFVIGLLLRSCSLQIMLRKYRS
jgi:class 3 adenylate cyclase